MFFSGFKKKASTDEHKSKKKSMFVSPFLTSIVSNFHIHGFRRDLDFPSANVVVSLMDNDSWWEVVVRFVEIDLEKFIRNDFKHAIIAYISCKLVRNWEFIKANES